MLIIEVTRSLLLLPLLLLQHEPIRSKPAQPKRRTFQDLQTVCREAASLQSSNLNAGTGPGEKQHLINAAASHDRQLYQFEETTF